MKGKVSPGTPSRPSARSRARAASAEPAQAPTSSAHSAGVAAKNVGSAAPTSKPLKP